MGTVEGLRYWNLVGNYGCTQTRLGKGMIAFIFWSSLKKEDELLDDIHKSSRDLWKNGLELNDLREKLHKEKKKNEELNAILWENNHDSGEKRKSAHLQGLLLELKSMGDVTV
jgi:hypothetical protein